MNLDTNTAYTVETTPWMREWMGRSHENYWLPLRDNLRASCLILGSLSAQPSHLPLTWGRPDPLAATLSQDEWRTLEAGLKQRVRLIDRLALDLASTRSSLTSGMVPYEIFHRLDPMLLWEPKINPKPVPPFLHVYATDVARLNNGSFVVLRDHTRRAEGLGVALEIRTHMARVAPNMIARAGARRLAAFFRGMRNGLASLRSEPDARIVLLSRETAGVGYSEHAYLASYLGYTLARPADLLVRNGTVWLKTLDGLQQVRILFRWVPDRCCDPLERQECGPDEGVPGLLGVIRGGQVSPANYFGSGLLESPFLMPFWNRMATEWLGESLILPHVDAYWGGDASHTALLADVPSSLDFHHLQEDGTSLCFPASSRTPDQENFIRTGLAYDPNGWVALDHLEGAPMPFLAPEGWTMAPTRMRFFASRDARGPIVMPGGLAFSSGTLPCGEPRIAIKDIWVRGVRSSDEDSLWLEGRSRTPGRFEGTLPSRVGENLFWTGRYAERSEAMARFLRASLQLRQDAEEMPDSPYQEASVRILATADGFADIEMGFDVLDTDAWLMLYNRLAGPSSLAGTLQFNLQAMLNSAVSTRELWSRDTWRILDRMLSPYASVVATGQDTIFHADHLDNIITGLSAFAGLTMESITRGPTWVLLDAGRRLERALFVLASIRHLATPRGAPLLRHLLLESILGIHESLITYRRTYRTTPDAADVMDLLLKSPINPRGARFQIAALANRIGRLPSFGPEMSRNLLELQQEMDAFVPPDSTDEGPEGALDTLLHGWEYRIHVAANQIAAKYFTHSPHADFL